MRETFRRIAAIAIDAERSNPTERQMGEANALHELAADIQDAPADGAEILVPFWQGRAEHWRAAAETAREKGLKERAEYDQGLSDGHRLAALLLAIEIGMPITLTEPAEPEGETE